MFPSRLIWVGWPALLLATGCHPGHTQSMLHPAGPGAAKVADLWWFLFAVCTAVFVAVLVLLVMALLAPREDREERRPGTAFIVITGVAVPTVVLIAILIYSLLAMRALRNPGPDALTVEVIGHQWWWEVRYPGRGIVTANEIHIPVGEPVRLHLKAQDVIHSFWVPNLHPKTDMIPRQVNVAWMQADRPGTFRGQCAEFCGKQHAWMAFHVIAQPPDEYEAWASRAAGTPPAPEGEKGRRGREVFFRAACQNCHAIKGEPRAVGRVGPDLTWVGGRASLGAGLLETNHGTMSGWIANSQAVKPGNLMPRYYLPSDDLNALTEYLMGLK